MLDRLTSMAVFVRVVDAGSLRAASARLGITPQMVGRHIESLEEKLGAKLLHRTTRANSLTEVGEAYYEGCRTMLAHLEELDQLAGGTGASPRGSLRLSAPTTYGVQVLIPLVARYLQYNPKVELELELSDRMAGLVGEHYEVAFRVGDLPDSGLIARRLADWRLLLCASPSYIARRGEPKVPVDLVDHDCLAFTFASGAVWQDWSLRRGSTAETVRILPRAKVNEGRGLVELACQGLGVAMAAETLVSAELASGRLVRVLPDWNCPTRPVHLLFAKDQHQTHKLRGFIDFAVAELRSS